MATKIRATPPRLGSTALLSLPVYQVENEQSSTDQQCDDDFDQGHHHDDRFYTESRSTLGCYRFAGLVSVEYTSVASTHLC